MKKTQRLGGVDLRCSCVVVFVAVDSFLALLLLLLLLACKQQHEHQSTFLSFSSILICCACHHPRDAHRVIFVECIS